jgi:DNA polymerase
MSGDWESLRAACEGCQRCELGKTSHKLVFGVGLQTSPVLFVGEGPGQQEDLQGEPFVGAAGQLLDEMLSIVDLGRRNCYIANIVKCRPPGNRDPKPEEQEACVGWLYEQMRLLRPKLVICLGRIAAMGLIDPEFRITRQHGQWFEKDGRRWMAIYHPSALLRDPEKRPETFMDLRALRKEIRERCSRTYTP